LIDRYLAELSARLHGPARLKADLLAEARDGLLDATAALVTRGQRPIEAARVAVEQFGPVAAIAPAYQAELGVAQGRRTAWWVLGVICAQPFVWGVAHDAVAGARSPRDALETPVQLIGGTAGVLALLLVLATGVGQRYLPLDGALARISGRFAVAVAVVLDAGGLLLTLRGPVDTMLHPAGLPWTTAFLFAPLLGVVLSARRSLACAA
jgi:hypothetical protein